MDAIISLLTTLDSLSPLAVIGLLCTIVFMLVKGKTASAKALHTVQTNHLHELPEKTQTIFKLSRYEHKSVKEIAGHMQLTEKAVEYHITRSLKLLRRHLRNYLNTYSTLL